MRASFFLLLLAGCPQAPVDDDSVAMDDDTSGDDDSAIVDDDSSTDDDSAADDDSAGDDDLPGPPWWEDRILLVYNENIPESLAVAEHYAAARGLDLSVLCPVAPSDPAVVSRTDYELNVADRVLACIDSEWDRYLLFVTFWGVPYRVDAAAHDLADGSVITSASLDALLTRPHHADDLPVSPSWNPYYEAPDSEAGTWPAPTRFADWRAAYSEHYYLVGRVDGATAQAAMDLVDDSLVAEELARSGQLDGLACVDRGWQAMTDDEFGSYASVEWDLLRTKEILEEHGFTVLYDENVAEIGTEPAPLRCDGALYYAGWYSFNQYNDVFSWAPGAVGFHFDSCSACDPRGGPNWAANGLSRGVVATMGAVGEPYVAGLMGYDQFFVGFFDGLTFIEAASQATPVTDWMATFLGDPLYAPYAAWNREPEAD